MAALTSLHYGNFEMSIQERAFFSEASNKHKLLLDNLFKQYYTNNGLVEDSTVLASTYRTSLELWRLIFSIPVEEFSNTMPIEDAELNLFKVILTLNERIFKFKKNSQKELQLDELIFLNSFLNNDSNDYELQKVLQPQSYYFYQLIKFIPTNEVMKCASDKLLADWGINTWKQYYSTIIWLAKNTDDYFKEHQNGVPIIPIDIMTQNDETGLFAKSLIEHLYINEDDYIPAEYGQADKKEDVNIDYRKFRSKPFIKLKDGSGFIVINIQLLCERLYNSLFFDFMPLINGRKGSVGFFDYNKEFVEKVLFQNTFFRCLREDIYTWPIRNSKSEDEDSHEPDFYARYPKGELLIMECKAIKMNGEIRDYADYDRLLDELHEKVVLKTRNLDPSRKEFKGIAEPIGIGQIIHHIDSIEADTFKWDKNLPDQVAYYPIIVFEDIRLLQPGLMSILNRWFYEELSKIKEIDLAEINCLPIIPVSINTLYLYDDIILKKGMFKIIEDYIRLSSKCHKDGKYHVDQLSDFDAYLHTFPFKKNNEIAQWILNK
ncbi:MAG: hypothetical protein IIT48_07470 [Lachnospiraceae bacterium]|nr:hypothetical protein [Lachnospiraceae bacterium]